MINNKGCCKIATRIFITGLFVIRKNWKILIIKTV